MVSAACCLQFCQSFQFGAFLLCSTRGSDGHLTEESGLVPLLWLSVYCRMTDDGSFFFISMQL